MPLMRRKARELFYDGVVIFGKHNETEIKNEAPQ